MAMMAAAQNQPGIGIYCDPSIAGLLRGGPKGPWTITGKMVQNAGFTERTDQTPNVIMKGDFATGQNKLRLPIYIKTDMAIGITLNKDMTGKKIFFARHEVSGLVDGEGKSVAIEDLEEREVILFSGIARPESS